MHNEYDQQIAHHYGAFRPSLHFPILNKCINDKIFKLGLDVGCGTGQSSIALINFCEKVIGIDPSKDMLEKGIKNENIMYQYFSGKSLPFENNQFDIVTFAGSLFYAKSQLLVDEVNRVIKDKGNVVVYDFEILLDDVLVKLNVQPIKDTAIKYNHEENFSGLNQGKLKTKKISAEMMSIKIAPSDLAHLLLSSKENYNLLGEKFGAEELFKKIKRELIQLNKNENFSIEAGIYFSVYVFEK
ncbi:MAG: class I SAM-dependent methyltransferase [Bacteroidota bacterium]